MSINRDSGLDPKELIRIVNSNAGKQLISLIQANAGENWDSILNSLSQGNYTDIKTLIDTTLKTKEANELLNQIGGTHGK